MLSHSKSCLGHIQLQSYLTVSLNVQEGDPAGWWEEAFKGHTDSKPKGPQAISVDLSFPGFQHVYGIPEHAASFALKPTTGLAPSSQPHQPQKRILAYLYILCRP